MACLINRVCKWTCNRKWKSFLFMYIWLNRRFYFLSFLELQLYIFRVGLGKTKNTNKSFVFCLLFTCRQTFFFPTSRILFTIDNFCWEKYSYKALGKIQLHLFSYIKELPRCLVVILITPRSSFYVILLTCLSLYLQFFFFACEWFFLICNIVQSFSSSFLVHLLN